MTIIEILADMMRGHRFIPSKYPSLAGTVKDVVEASDIDAGSWPVILFEEYEAGVDGRYAMHDLNEQFEISKNGESNERTKS